MKCDKDKIDGIVYEIMINNIGNTRDGFEKELVDKVSKCNNFGEAVALAMASYYVEGLQNTRTLIVEALDKILNKGKLGE